MVQDFISKILLIVHPSKSRQYAETVEEIKILNRLKLIEQLHNQSAEQTPLAFNRIKTQAFHLSPIVLYYLFY